MDDFVPTMKSVGASKSANKPVAEPKEEKIDFSKVEVEPLFKDFVDLIHSVSLTLEQ